jgi:hypothetical protein
MPRARSLPRRSPLRVGHRRLAPRRPSVTPATDTNMTKPVSITAKSLWTKCRLLAARPHAQKAVRSRSHPALSPSSESQSGATRSPGYSGLFLDGARTLRGSDRLVGDPLGDPLARLRLTAEFCDVVVTSDDGLLRSTAICRFSAASCSALSKCASDRMRGGRPAAALGGADIPISSTA